MLCCVAAVTGEMADIHILIRSPFNHSYLEDFCVWFQDYICLLHMICHQLLSYGLRSTTAVRLACVATAAMFLAYQVLPCAG